MSLYTSRVLSRKGCENTVLREQQAADKLRRQQNIAKDKFRQAQRSFDTEARQRDNMRAHWDFHRQMLAIQQDKFTQFNLMTAARDDIYRRRRESAYRRRIERYNDQNEAKAAWTEEFYLKKDRLLNSLPDVQRELLGRKLIMTGHSTRNEIELYRYHDENPTMAVHSMTDMPDLRPMTVPI
jgi:hypothetical protein